MKKRFKSLKLAALMAIFITSLVVFLYATITNKAESGRFSVRQETTKEEKMAKPFTVPDAHYAFTITNDDLIYKAENTGKIIDVTLYAKRNAAKRFPIELLIILIIIGIIVVIYLIYQINKKAKENQAYKKYPKKPDPDNIDNIVDVNNDLVSDVDDNDIN